MARPCETPLRDLPPSTPLTLGLWTTASQAAKTLLEAGCGEALVLDAGRPLGVVTTRGLARVLAVHGADMAHLAVRDFMDPVAVSPQTDRLPAAVRHLLAAPSRRLAVVDARGQAVGLLAPYHIAKLCGSLDELAGRTVASAMAKAVVTAGIGEDLSLVLERMIRTGVGGVVVAEADRPRGMFTARDAVALLAKGQAIRGRLVADFMRTPVAAISPHLPLTEAVGGMDGAGAGRLTVTDAAGYLLGLLTWTDVAEVISQVLSDAEFARLRERADFYSDLYDNASQGLFRLDLNGRPLAANKTLALLLGYHDVADFLEQAGQSAHPLRLDVPERRELLVSALAQKEPVAFETRVFHHDGSSSELYCVMRVVRNSLGVPVVLEGACADFPVGAPPGSVLSHEGDYRSIVEHQTELICRFDAGKRLIMVNPAFARYWSKTPEACIAENFQPEVPAEDLALMAKRIAALTPSRPTTGFEHRVVRPDGRIRWQRWTVRAIFDAQDELLEYQSVGRDITARKLAEDRLKHQYDYVRSLVESIPLPVFFKTPDGRYTGCNQAFEALFGLPRCHIIGHTVHDFQTQEMADLFTAKDAELLEHGGWQVYEAELPTVAGPRHMTLRKSIIREVEGGVVGIVGVLLDITDRKVAEAAAAMARVELETGLTRHAEELRQANDRLVAEVAERTHTEALLRQKIRFLDTVLSSLQDGISVLSPDLTVVMVNEAMRTLYTRAGDLIGRKCHEIYQGLAAPCEACPALRVLATHKPAISVVRKVDGAEQTGWLELFCYPLFDEDGRVTGVAEIVRDVTADKKLEAELAAALERAEAGSQAKGAFLANMSHEIRTPLNAVLGYVQLMLRDHLDARQRERLAVVEESAGTLLSIINDILDYSKIEAGRMEIKAESFDLQRCLESVVKEQEVLARNKGLPLTLEIDKDVPRAVLGDGLRLRQILRNLVNNAVKYTERGRVTLRVGSQGAQGDQIGRRVTLCFAVIDTGVGIPVAQQSTIFDSFTQVDGGLTKRQAGTGLGLAICRSLAGLMGGGVFMESTPDLGSVFWLECPFETAQPSSRAGNLDFPEKWDNALPRLRILLVEDNRVNRIFALDLLESRGHELVVAENGRDALDVLTQQPVDVVLMDIQMPVMDGLAATRAIRAGHMNIDPGLPVVGLSAYALDQERERFLAAGLDDYIIKPIDVDAFFAAVGRVLARRGRPLVLDGQAAKPRSEAILDTAGLTVQYRDKSGLLARVGREFISSVPEQLESLETALAEDDMPVCERVAHTLKGNAAMFGAATMRALASEAEVAAASGDAERFRSLAPALCDACRAVVDNMDTFLRRLEK
ncbi:MAG: PAS domain-containing protein [Solidesulfovibrio sp.]